MIDRRGCDFACLLRVTEAGESSCEVVGWDGLEQPVDVERVLVPHAVVLRRPLPDLVGLRHDQCTRARDVHRHAALVGRVE